MIYFNYNAYSKTIDMADFNVNDAIRCNHNIATLVLNAT